MTNDPWDDERLAAAYAARGEAHPTPGDLTVSTMAAIRSGARPATVSRWPRVLAAAAAVAVVFGGLAIAGLGSRGPNPGAATPSDASAEATAGEGTASPPASGSSSTDAPTQIAGLTVISVSDAIAIRDSGVDGRELAVRGWYTAIPLPCPSMDPGPSSPIERTCDHEISWLMRDKEDLGLPGSGQPTGPAIHAYLGGVGSLAPSPSDAVVIGHFDDRRADQCPSDAEAGCRDEFVVDRICWADGVEVELSDLNELGGPRTSIDHEVATLVLEAVPDATILSAVTVPGGRLPEFEPLFATDDEFSLKGTYGVWIVRVVAGGQPDTYLVVDGTRRVYRMTPDGRVDFIGDPATGGPGETWPPGGATMVDVPGVEVAVVDASGRLRGAREGSRDPSSLGGDLGAKPASVFTTTTPDELLLTWAGSGCDRRAIVTIDEALSAIAVERIETPSCEGEARVFGLLLTFDGPVDSSTFTVSATHRVMPTP